MRLRSVIAVVLGLAGLAACTDGSAPPMRSRFDGNPPTDTGTGSAASDDAHSSSTDDSGPNSFQSEQPQQTQTQTAQSASTGTGVTADIPHLHSNADDAQAATPIFPSFRLNGTGNTYCSDDHGGPTGYGITANLVTSLTASNLTSTMSNTWVHCGDDTNCQSNAEDGIADDNTTSIFTLLTADQLKQWQSTPGFSYEPYLMYAMAVTRSDNERFTFDQPLPISPWVNTHGLYANMKPSETWSANVTGTKSMTVHVTVTKASDDGQNVVVNMETDIDQGNDDYSYYASFPMAHTESSTINTAQGAITTVSTLSLAPPSQKQTGNCDAKDHTSFTFTACDATVGATTTPLGCTFAPAPGTGQSGD